MSNLNLSPMPESNGNGRIDLAKLQLFEKILKGNVEGIAITDTQGNIEWVNHSFSALTGHTQDEVIGKNMGTLFIGEENAYASLTRKLHEDNHQQAEIWMHQKNDGEFLAGLTLSAVRSEADMITHHVLEFSDITEIRRAQDELNQRTRE